MKNKSSYAAICLVVIIAAVLAEGYCAFVLEPQAAMKFQIYKTQTFTYFCVRPALYFCTGILCTLSFDVHLAPWVRKTVQLLSIAGCLFCMAAILSYANGYMGLRPVAVRFMKLPHMFVFIGLPLGLTLKPRT